MQKETNPFSPQPIFVSDLDSMSTPQQCLKRNFVNSINESQPAKSRQKNNNIDNESISRIKLEEFRLLVREALQKTKAFTSNEVESIEKELIHDVDASENLRLLSASDHIVELTKKLGLPTLKFVFQLIKNDPILRNIYSASGLKCPTFQRCLNSIWDSNSRS